MLVMVENSLIVIEGVDGSGKGTQIELLKKKFPEFLFTREPGGTEYGEKIREIMLAKRESYSVLGDFLMFWSLRAELIDTLILPTIARGVHVISDRFDASTWAFQVCGEERRNLEPLFERLRSDIMTLAPDLYVVLDLPPEVSAERLKKSGAASRFDVKPLAFHERVREGYREFSRRFIPSGRIIFIDADRPPEVVHADVVREIERVL